MCVENDLLLSHRKDTLERGKGGGMEGGEECLIKGTWPVLKQLGSCFFVRCAVLEF